MRLKHSAVRVQKTQNLVNRKAGQESCYPEMLILK